MDATPGLKPGIEAVGFQANPDSRNLILPAYVRPERTVRGFVVEVISHTAGVAWVRRTPQGDKILVRDARPVVRRRDNADS